MINNQVLKSKESQHFFAIPTQVFLQFLVLFFGFLSNYGEHLVVVAGVDKSCDALCYDHEICDFVSLAIDEFARFVYQLSQPLADKRQEPLVSHVSEERVTLECAVVNLHNYSNSQSRG